MRGGFGTSFDGEGIGSATETVCGVSSVGSAAYDGSTAGAGAVARAPMRQSEIAH